MLTDEHLDLFRQFRVRAMGGKLREIVDDPAYDPLTFEEKARLMLDAEAEARRNRKLEKLQREARLKNPCACVEDIACLDGRGIHRDRMARLAECRWVDEAGVVVIISKTGGGKSYVAQALAVAALRKMRTVRYTRLQDLAGELDRCRSTDVVGYYEAMERYKCVDLLVIDDFATTPVGTQAAIDLFEICEARDQRRATIIASQLEPNEWYLRIEGELMADSILNRLATGATFIDIEGPNMREYLAKSREEAAS